MLPLPCQQMHFDTRGSCVPDYVMVKSGQIEIATKFTVDPQKNILVKSRRNPERIIIGKSQIALPLDQINAQKQLVGNP